MEERIVAVLGVRVVHEVLGAVVDIGCCNVPLVVGRDDVEPEVGRLDVGTARC